MISGDWARLQATVRGLRALARVPAKVAAASAIAIKSEIDSSFEISSDPYGHQWEEHASATIRRWGAHPLLRLTGAGKEQITVAPISGAGIAVTSPSAGLAYSQGGTVNQPARRFLPTDQMPAKWRRALERAATAEMTEMLRAAG